MKNSKLMGYVALAGALLGLYRAITELRSAGGKGDKLLLTHAVTTVAHSITRGALAVRDLREEEDE